VSAAVAVAVTVVDESLQAFARSLLQGPAWQLDPADGRVDVVLGDAPDATDLERVSALVDDAEARGAPLALLAPASDAIAVRRLLEAGVGALVPPEGMLKTLRPSLEALAAGQVCFPLTARPRRSRGERLSMREKQVLGMVVLGQTNAQIAARLHLAESTVKSHLGSSFRKLGVRSRQEAAELILNPANGLGTGILSITR
jgi:DNA-binding NarL/FixJ family response regulator